MKERLESLNDYLKSGVTASLIGSSGAGKSTLVNHWMNADVQHVQAVRKEDRQAQAQEREKWKKITKSARQKVRW
ncbi:GTPase RsgA [Ferroacidibacillus organovorans]|uniref:EngC GTPase domain-containing protein n=1 Tax=Ferroacidibacillus organovorans TaxID=1765683 RepID=A0A124IVU5_9BACL|nr:GTPase RsgA [Ferroacidibacillus organovorans]KUO95346.1 hypothetical protein ATW55_10820 [Ferroacidibacillus organovorans]KUO97348.1 hypothetical protein ATW55_05600 [Ferroacidibacillus organovorans]